MKTALFDYHLPKRLIAQRPDRPRDRSRLMVLDRRTKKIEEARFRDIGRFFRPGDLLVLNDTKVFRARLIGRFATGGKAEILLLRPVRSGKKFSLWQALGKPGGKLAPGTRVFGFGWHSTIRANGSKGSLHLDFPLSVPSVHRLLERSGHIPVPPYIEREPAREEDYQTVYARTIGSVAAPTAGFHFTKRLIAELKRRGVRFAALTLHVGVGTFQPIRSSLIEEHQMHAEWAEIPAATLRAIRETKRRGGRVIAVGTTTTRALEGLIGLRDREVQPPREVGPRMRTTSRRGWVSLFITPGYCFRVVDALITNFHLPRSTLLALVSAFAGRDLVLRVYRRAIRKKYRFYSFGDAMLIV